MESCLLVAAVSLFACGTEPAQPPPVVEVGAGIDAFEPVADVIYLVQGPQGGRHIIGNVRMEGLEPGTTREDAPRTRFDVFKLDGTRASTDIPPFRVVYVEAADGSFMLPFGRFVFIDSSAAELLDQEVDFKVTLVDRSGAAAEDVRRVTVKPYINE